MVKKNTQNTHRHTHLTYWNLKKKEKKNLNEIERNEMLLKWIFFMFCWKQNKTVH